MENAAVMPDAQQPSPVRDGAAGARPPAPLRRLQAATLALCMLLFAGVVAAGWPDLVFALALEHSPLAWLQTMLLVACATAAALCAGVQGGGPSRGWTLVCLLLLAAAIDDRFMGHERVQAWAAQRIGEAPAALWWTQRLTLAYLPIAGSALWWLRRVMDARAWRWCLGALGVGVVALLMDAAFDAAGPQVIEETLEYAAEALMLTGLLSEAHIRANRLR